MEHLLEIIRIHEHSNGNSNGHVKGNVINQMEQQNKEQQDAEVQANLNNVEDIISQEENDIDRALRPLSFDDFAGQDAILENLKVFVSAAKQREEALDRSVEHGGLLFVRLPIHGVASRPPILPAL